MLSLILFLYFSVVFYEFLVLCFCKKEKCLLKTNQRTDKTSYNLNFISILGLSRSASIRKQTMEKTHSLFINLPLYSNASSSCMCTNHTNERMWFFSFRTKLIWAIRFSFVSLLSTFDFVVVVSWSWIFFSRCSFSRFLCKNKSLILRQTFLLDFYFTTSNFNHTMCK